MNVKLFSVFIEICIEWVRARQLPETNDQTVIAAVFYIAKRQLRSDRLFFLEICPEFQSWRSYFKGSCEKCPEHMLPLATRAGNCSPKTEVQIRPTQISLTSIWGNVGPFKNR